MFISFFLNKMAKKEKYLLKESLLKLIYSLQQPIFFLDITVSEQNTQDVDIP